MLNKYKQVILTAYCTGLPGSNLVPSPTTFHPPVATVGLKNTQLTAPPPSLPSHYIPVVKSLMELPHSRVLALYSSVSTSSS